MTALPDASRALNRVLLREAGEHLGTLSEQAFDRWSLSTSTVKSRPSATYDRYLKLRRLSREVLEIANA